jgi:putative transposase
MRGAGRDVAILAQRARVYAAANAQRPTRWSGATRNGSPIMTDVLHPQHVADGGLTPSPNIGQLS